MADWTSVPDELINIIFDNIPLKPLELGQILAFENAVNMVTWRVLRTHNFMAVTQYYGCYGYYGC